MLLIIYRGKGVNKNDNTKKKLVDMSLIWIFLLQLLLR